jgi:hypothetical protein
VESGSALSGNFWDLSNGDLVFEDGAIANMNDWELKGVNTVTFKMGVAGFTTLTPNNFRNDGNNPASPATLIADDSFIVDMANYGGGAQTVTLMDFTSDLEGMDDATFQNATLTVLNVPVGSVTIHWNDAEESIELFITKSIPTLSEWGMIILFIGLIALAYRKFGARPAENAVAGG